MKESILIIVFVLLASMAFSSNAATLSCDGCSTQQMHTVAHNQLMYASIKYPAYVTNFANGTVKKYVFNDNMTPDFDPEFDIYEAWVESYPVEAEIKTLISNLYSVRGPVEFDLSQVSSQGALGTLEVTAQETELPQSAWQVVDDSVMDQRVANWITHRKEDFFQRAANWLSTFNPFTGFTPGNIQLSIRIRFPDGSSAIYLFNTKTKAWARLEDETRDSHGNIIPETRADFARGGVETYHFGDGGPDLDMFLYRADLMDIPITPPSGGGGGGGGGAIGVVCSSLGGDVTCAITIL